MNGAADVASLAHARAKADILAGFVDLVAEAVADKVAGLLASVPDPQPAAESWRLLDLEETAARLGRSTRWVRDKARAGELPQIRLDGGALRFDLEDIQAFAAARRVGADPLAGRLQAERDSAWRAGSGLCSLTADQKAGGVR